MVLGGGAFGECLDPEGGAPMNGISALVKETPREVLPRFCQVRTQGGDSHL